jgi:hypothetical protein
MGTKYPNGEEIFNSEGQVNKPSVPVETQMRGDAEDNLDDLHYSSVLAIPACSAPR